MSPGNRLGYGFVDTLKYSPADIVVWKPDTASYVGHP